MSAKFIAAARSSDTGKYVRVFQRSKRQDAEIRVEWYKRNLPNSYSDWSINEQPVKS